MCPFVYDCMPRMFIPLSRTHVVRRQHLQVLLISELFKLCFRHIKYTYFKLHYLYANIFWGVELMFPEPSLLRSVPVLYSTLCKVNILARERFFEAINVLSSCITCWCVTLNYGWP